MPYTSSWGTSSSFDKHGVAWCIENPTNSAIWNIPCFAYALAPGVFAHCQACAFGSGRDKRTSFLCSHDAIDHMGRMCPGCSVHEPWGVDSQGTFNTSKEAEYPPRMCQALCDVAEAIAAKQHLPLGAAQPVLAKAHRQAADGSTLSLSLNTLMSSSVHCTSFLPCRPSSAPRQTFRTCRQDPGSYVPRKRGMGPGCASSEFTGPLISSFLKLRVSCIPLTPWHSSPIISSKLCSSSLPYSLCSFQGSAWKGYRNGEAGRSSLHHRKRC